MFITVFIRSSIPGKGGWMDGYSCDWSLNSLFLWAVTWNIRRVHWWTPDSTFLLVDSLLVSAGEALWGQEWSLHIQIFLLLHDLKTAFCIFCNMVFCHDRHWNSMWNSCLDASIFSWGKLSSPLPPPPLYNYSLKGKLLILYCVILFFINRFHYSILKLCQKMMYYSSKFVLLFS